jgi:cytochrome c oxidase cbb3-type subunit 3
MPRAGRGGFGRGPVSANPTTPYATVTLSSGEKIKGAPLRVTDFDVTLRMDDGSTKTWARSHGVPKVEITDPLQAHIDIMTSLSDTNMHNLAAYLSTLK